MHLLLITGFLGSGKTTLVIRFAKAIANENLRVAILVNEIGEIGIDNQLMRQLDLNVWELVNGCICCTLSSDLITTLQQLQADYAPHLVILEPSGAADPHNILNALPYYQGQPLESIRTATILDPLRLPILMEVLTPLLSSQIQQADLILIGKCDLASAEEIEFAIQTGREIHPAAKIISIQAQEGLDPELVSALAPWLN